MGSQFPELPPLVPEQFEWHQSKTDPSVCQRRAVGAESIVGMEVPNKMGANDLYLMAELQLHSPGVTLTTLKEKLQAVWARLRFQHPEIACTASWEDGNFPLIQYRSPKDDQDALAWAERAIRVETSSRSGLDIRTAIEEQRQAGSSPADAVTIYVAAPVVNKAAVLGETPIQLVLHANHLYFDGISIRLLLGDLLRALGSEWSTTDSEKIPWGEETKNLGPSIFSVLDSSQEVSGPKFEAMRVELIKNIANIRRSWGTTHQSGTPGTPRSIFHAFSISDSEKMIRAVKERLGPKFTITHLGHAAVLFALLKQNPVPADAPDTKIYLSPSPVNSRRFLRKEYAQGTKLYFPICQATAPLLFDNINSYDPSDSDKDKLRENLARACKVAKEQYDLWLGQPSVLTASLSFTNFITASLTQGGNMEVPSNPLFISDGINERYIPREVINVTTQEKALTVQNIRFMLNQYMPFMSIRLDSFQDRSQLSLSYNEGTYNAEQAETFLRETEKMMLAFAE